jgi:predicted  nucleic acid-binding Zn-ribbon protein
MRGKKEGPLNIQKMEEKLNARELKFKKDYDHLESLKKERRKIEQEVQHLEDKIKSSQVKLSHIKSNKEYRAVLKEIEDFKKGQFVAEDKVIQLMEAIEELQKKCRDNEVKQGELREHFEKDKGRIAKELSGLDRELADLEKKRTVLFQTVDQDLLKRYLLLVNRRGGQAISSVVGGVCQTCHLGIPPQQFNELQKGHILLTCPNCSRIIYWGEDKHFQGMLE